MSGVLHILSIHYHYHPTQADLESVPHFHEMMDLLAEEQSEMENCVLLVVDYHLMSHSYFTNGFCQINVHFVSFACGFRGVESRDTI